MESWLPYSPPGQGFDEFYFNLPPWDAHHFYANFRADGSSLAREGEHLDETTGDRMEDEARAALAFIERNHDKPFFLYFAYSGPHTQVYLPREKFAEYPADMPQRRRAALSMMETMDDGVGNEEGCRAV